MRSLLLLVKKEPVGVAACEDIPGCLPGEVFRAYPTGGPPRAEPGRLDASCFLAGLGMPWCPPEELLVVAVEKEVWASGPA